MREVKLTFYLCRKRGAIGWPFILVGPYDSFDKFAAAHPELEPLQLRYEYRHESPR